MAGKLWNTVHKTLAEVGVGNLFFYKRETLGSEPELFRVLADGNGGILVIEQDGATPGYLPADTPVRAVVNEEALA